MLVLASALVAVLALPLVLATLCMEVGGTICFIASTLIPGEGMGDASLALIVCTGLGSEVTELVAGAISTAMEGGFGTAGLARMVGVGGGGLG